MRAIGPRDARADKLRQDAKLAVSAVVEHIVQAIRACLHNPPRTPVARAQAERDALVHGRLEASLDLIAHQELLTDRGAALPTAGVVSKNTIPCCAHMSWNTSLKWS
eukprot:49786-Prymnesium_polylepis.1